VRLSIPYKNNPINDWEEDKIKYGNDSLAKFLNNLDNLFII